MIDIIALVLGHALLAAALLRLALRVDVDEDPLIERLAAEAVKARAHKRQSRRGAASTTPASADNSAGV